MNPKQGGPTRPAEATKPLMPTGRPRVQPLLLLRAPVPCRRRCHLPAIIQRAIRIASM